MSRRRPGTVKMCSPCPSPRLYITVIFAINIRLNDCLRWDSILGLHTSQLDMLPLDRMANISKRLDLRKCLLLSTNRKLYILMLAMTYDGLRRSLQGHLDAIVICRLPVTYELFTEQTSAYISNLVCTFPMSPAVFSAVCGLKLKATSQIYIKFSY